MCYNTMYLFDNYGPTEINYLKKKYQTHNLDRKDTNPPIHTILASTIELLFLNQKPYLLYFNCLLIWTAISF